MEVPSLEHPKKHWSLVYNISMNFKARKGVKQNHTHTYFKVPSLASSSQFLFSSYIFWTNLLFIISQIYVIFSTQLIHVIIFGETNCNAPHYICIILSRPPVISSFLIAYPTILLNSQFSKIINFRFSFKAKDQHLYSHKEKENCSFIYFDLYIFIRQSQSVIQSVMP